MVRKAALALVPMILVGACNPHITEAEEAVRQMSSDPAAVQFKDVQKCSSDQTVIMGEANRKNQYGAYSGFETFLYAENKAAFAGDDGFLDLLSRCYGTTVEPQDGL